MADLTTTGNVGIGAPTPNAWLTIGNNVSGGGPNGSYGSYQIILYDFFGVPNQSYGMGVEAFYMWFNSNGGYKFYINNTESAVISTSGFVGVGIASPAYYVDAAGSVAGMGAYVMTSDCRYKTNVAPLEDGSLNKVMKLRPVSFLWRDPKDAGMRGKQLGFLAQEVEKILPSTVLTRDDADHTKSMKYNEIIVMLTKAMQEQQAEIEALKADIARLNSQEVRAQAA